MRRRRIVTETLPRETIFLAQTPQAFRRDVLGDARSPRARRRRRPPTRRCWPSTPGIACTSSTGDPANVKITTAADLEARAPRARRGRRAPARVGIGYDLHRLVEGRPLVLGGVTVPSERGALGHSDADVVCHAVTDAILGAARAGDIGQHFPDTDPRWKDASSVELLREARRARARARASRSRTSTSSSSSSARRSGRIATRSEPRLADALGIDASRVSVKGKTNEGVDAVGRGEAIAAHAVALLRVAVLRLTAIATDLSMRVRFAPSPTGQLHVGNARTALFNWLLAHGKDGTFILRIEDTDAERSTRESEAEHPRGPALARARLGRRARRRRRRTARIASPSGCTSTRRTRTSCSRGEHAYYCFCSPAKLEADRQADLAAGRPPKYHGTCRATAARRGAGAHRGRRAAGRPLPRAGVRRGHASRISCAARSSFSTDVIGDSVLVRSDGRPQYNFAVVVDDALMEITHVIRGEDHISNTPRQVLLYQALGFAPPEFAHLSLVMGPDHTPLSKRHGATSVAEFRARGYLPEALVNYLALIGWSPRRRRQRETSELLPVDELARRFAIEDVGHSAGVFDQEKLAWMNRHYMKAAAPARLAAEIAALLHWRAAIVTRRTDEAMEYRRSSVLPMAVGSVDRLEEIPDRLRFLFDFDPAAALATREVAERAARAGRARGDRRAAPSDLSDAGWLDRESFRAAANRVKQRTGQKGRALFHPIRVALTGEGGGPELDLAVPAIDRGAALPPLPASRRSSGAGSAREVFAQGH